MPVLQRPLADRVARPLRIATVWGLVAGATGVVIALAVGGVGYGVTWIASLLGDGQAEFPWGVVRGIGAVAAVTSLASSTWAASFAATEEVTVRATLATLAGAAVLISGTLFDMVSVLLAAAAVAWAAAIPFEAWTRLVARILPAIVAVVAVEWVARRAATVVAAVIVAASYPAAASILGIADAAWRRTRRGIPDGG